MFAAGLQGKRQDKPTLSHSVCSTQVRIRKLRSRDSCVTPSPKKPRVQDTIEPIAYVCGSRLEPGVVTCAVLNGWRQQRDRKTSCPLSAPPRCFPRGALCLRPDPLTIHFARSLQHCLLNVVKLLHGCSSGICRRVRDEDVC
jgi:hypothetical protein